MTTPAERLIHARERAGKSPSDAARGAGLNLPSYYDCEMGTDLCGVISLDELKRICDTVGIKSYELFCDQAVFETERISYPQLVERIRAYLVGTNCELSKLEEDLGFELKPCFENAANVGEFSVDWLCTLCDRIGLSWIHVLP